MKHDVLLLARTSKIETKDSIDATALSLEQRCAESSQNECVTGLHEAVTHDRQSLFPLRTCGVALTTVRSRQNARERFTSTVHNEGFSRHLLFVRG